MARYDVAGQWWSTVDKEDWPQDIESIKAIEKNWDIDTGDARQEIVLIGINMDQQDLIQQFDHCLLSDTEMLLGLEQWQTFENPFEHWE